MEERKWQRGSAIDYPVTTRGLFKISKLHQCFDGLLDPPWTSLGQLGPAGASWCQLGPAGASWCQLVQHPKVSKLPCPQAMSKSSTISSQSDDQQAGKFHKLGKSIW